jgi:hypothetical protein
VAKHEDKLGIRASSTCPVHFDEVLVPKSAILGELGKGLAIRHKKDDQLYFTYSNFLGYKMAIECLNAGKVPQPY